MNYRSIAFVAGTLLLVTGAAQALPVICSLWYGEDDLFALTVSMLVPIAVGLPLRTTYRADKNLGTREAFLIAVFGWVAISAVSTLPFLIHGSIDSFTDAFFEMMSGYTTTGATILTDIEVLPRGLLLWRSETHLLGGMGFLTLAILFLPHGVGGLRMFRAESSPGQVLTRERFTERNRDAIWYLWVIYLALNLAEIVLLMLGGLSLFDAACHAFGTVSTSGSSPYNASVGHYQSAYVDWVVILFMFLGGVTFMLFFFLMRREWKIVWINTELRWYLTLTAAFCIGAWLLLWKAQTYGALDSLRYGSFQVVSLLTTTGFTTADYELWPQSVQMLLFVVCFIGACAGSTTSGIKIIHYVLICKFGVAAIKKIFFQPLAVLSVRVNGRRVDNLTIYLAVCYFIVNIFLVLLGGVVLTLIDELDYLSAMSAVISALMNIGPGFGLIGPSENFAFMSDASKWFLSWNMLVGRLEMFSALVVFYPSFWRS
jgi:trk system potassium uptake protein TrkH